MDAIVVGGGLIGSAAAKYLAETDDVDVTAFAPPEPEDLAAASGPFASHYDQGRITRISDADPYWADAARRSIEQYRSIETRSGIAFYTERPLVFFTSATDQVLAVAAEHGGSAEQVDARWVAERTGVQAPSDYDGGIVCEHAPAGFIDPRRLVRAQLTLARAAGARVVESAVVRVHRDAGSGRITVTAADGATAVGDQVLFATGAYGVDLLGVELRLERRLRTVALVEVSGLPAERLPVLMFHGLDRPGLEKIYWVPPVRYPDGGVYLKVGGDSVPMVLADPADPAADIAGWFRHGGSSDEADDLAAVVTELLPGADVRLADRQPCVITMTETGRPLIDRIDDRVTVAVGGCGAAAKSSDALGRDAADLVLTP